MSSFSPFSKRGSKGDLSVLRIPPDLPLVKGGIVTFTSPFTERGIEGDLSVSQIPPGLPLSKGGIRLKAEKRH